MAAPPTVVDVERLVRLTGLSTDRIVTLFRNTRTRIALRVLSACDPPLSLDRLAGAVADADPELSRRSVRIALVHETLPKLEDYGLLEYELRSETVHVSGPVVGLDEPLGALAEERGHEPVESGEGRR